MKELYFSVDVETDGPIPGPNSMLSFGCVALDAQGTLHGTFETNLETLPGAEADPATAEWWKSQPEAWEACRRDLETPEVAMPDFVDWVTSRCVHAGPRSVAPVMVCMPSGFDFTFMYWYMVRFAGRSPFSFSCIDMRTYVMAMRKVGYKRTTKRYWPKRWFPDLPHTHVAIDDAMEQGLAFINMLKEDSQSLLLDDYQRANLLWLLRAVGWPHPEHPGIEPFTLADTGDWLGEIAGALEEMPATGVDPNMSESELREAVRQWADARDK